MGVNSDWPDLLHHVNKIKGRVVYKEDKATIIIDGREINQRNLKREIEKEFEKIDLLGCLELRMQGNFYQNGEHRAENITPNLLWMEAVR